MKHAITNVLTIVLLVVLTIVTPVFAAVVSTSDQKVDLMAVKGSGMDVMITLELAKQDKNRKIFQTNVEVLNKTTGHLKRANAKKSGIYKPITKTNTVGVVMQSTNYSCGPAALATVLNNLGINATEQELVILAGTDESGTTLYGLMQAAQAKGLNAVGMKLSVDELKKDDIVFLNIDEYTHYSIIKEVTYKSVKLADPSLGNIIIPKKEFKRIYSGNVLVITDLNTSIMDLCNSTETGTNSNDLQLNDKILKNGSIRSAKGKNLLNDFKDAFNTVINGTVRIIGSLMPGGEVRIKKRGNDWDIDIKGHG